MRIEFSQKSPLTLVIGNDVSSNVSNSSQENIHDPAPQDQFKDLEEDCKERQNPLIVYTSHVSNNNQETEEEYAGNISQVCNDQETEEEFAAKLDEDETLKVMSHDDDTNISQLSITSPVMFDEEASLNEQTSETLPQITISVHCSDRELSTLPCLTQGLDISQCNEPAPNVPIKKEVLPSKPETKGNAFKFNRLREQMGIHSEIAKCKQMGKTALSEPQCESSLKKHGNLKGCDLKEKERTCILKSRVKDTCSGTRTVTRSKRRPLTLRQNYITLDLSK